MRIKPIMSVIAMLGVITLFATLPFAVAASLFITIATFSAVIAVGLSYDARVAKKQAKARKVSSDLFAEYRTLLYKIEDEKNEMSRLLGAQSELLYRLIDLSHTELKKQNKNNANTQKQLALPPLDPTPEEKKILEGIAKLILLGQKFPLYPDHTLNETELRSLINATKKHHAEYRRGVELLLEQSEIYLSDIIKEFEKRPNNRNIPNRPAIFSNLNSVRAQLLSKESDKPRNLKPKK